MCFLKLHFSPNVIFRSTTSWRLSILILFTYDINSLFIFFRRILNLNSPSLTRWLFDKKIKIKTRLPYLSIIFYYCSFLTQLYYLVGIELPRSSVDWNSNKIDQNNDYIKMNRMPNLTIIIVWIWIAVTMGWKFRTIFTVARI